MTDEYEYVYEYEYEYEGYGPFINTCRFWR
jgi:hypothetical protein